MRDIVSIHRAIGNDVRGVTIIAEKPLLLFETANWERLTEAMHDYDANVLFQALVKNLPGGTLHRLHAVMVMHYAGLYARPSEMGEVLANPDTDAARAREAARGGR